MKIVRLYTGEDGHSHFEEIDLSQQPGGESGNPSAQPATSISFRFQQREPGRVIDWHTAPRRQYVIGLSGISEIEVGDGTTRRFGPGDVLLAEDLMGQGHITRSVGDEPRRSIFVTLD